jgi:hypothetical protein
VPWQTATGGTSKTGATVRIGETSKTALTPAAASATAGAIKAAKTSAGVAEIIAAPAVNGAAAVKANPAVDLVVTATSVVVPTGTTAEAMDRTLAATTAAEALKEALVGMTTPAATMAQIKAIARITAEGRVITVSRAEESVGYGIVRAMRSRPGSVMTMPSVGAAWMSSVEVNTVGVARKAIPALMTASARM